MWDVTVFFLLIYLWPRLWERFRPGSVAATYLILYAVGRVAIETVRIDDTPVYAGVRFNQIASVFAIATGLWCSPCSTETATSVVSPAMSPEPSYPYPPAYYLALVEHAAEPPFESAHEQTTYWGRQWGASDEVGPLRSVLMRKLRDEWKVVRDDCWDERAQALMDPAGRWYWDDRKAPDIARAQAQQQGLIDTLEVTGRRGAPGRGLRRGHVRAIYTRDPLVTVPGGAILGRLAPTMRKGEELHIHRALGALGMPILRTIHGTGMLEGGSFAKITPTVAAYSTSIRCNESGARAAGRDARLARHRADRRADGRLVDPPRRALRHGRVDKALVDPLGLPWWFLDRLTELGIEQLICPPGRSGRSTRSASGRRDGDVRGLSADA